MKTFFALFSALIACAAFAQTPGMGDTRPTPPSLAEQRGPVGGGTQKESPADVAEKAHSRSDRTINRCEKMDDAQRERCLRQEGRSAAGGTQNAEPATAPPPQNPR
ncbi:MAG: hypothetical protein JOZ85_01810 [Betaproteobacteria bacterium]|nr:hypothetical protein [Betaproteobacteria bacterium]